MKYSFKKTVMFALVLAALIFDAMGVALVYAAGSDKDITMFGFTTPAAVGVITGTDIAVAVPFGTNVSALVANFTTTGASVAVGAVTQISGVTANDFTNPVTYTVTAADASTQNYTVTVTISCGSTVTVTNNANSGAGTLRQAIANTCADGVINFDAALSSAIIHLASSLIISKNITIDGSALDSKVTISGDGAINVVVFRVNGGVTAALNSLIITKGVVYNSLGGGLNNGGTLTITNSIISGNAVSVYSGWAYGGGVYNTGTLTVTNSVVSGNSASQIGGGIYNNGGNLLIMNSAFSGNSAGAYGGGIYNSSGSLTVINSAFSGNSVIGGYGGGIYNSSGIVNVANSTFSGNSVSSHDGIYEYGGGIFNADSVTVTNSTFSGNSAARGGGIYNYAGTLTVINSTLSGNPAMIYGGGIYNAGGTLNYSNTIIANSVSGGDCVNDSAIGTNTKNLVEDGGCSAFFSGDPKLGSLADNGGPTRTFALLAGSTAIDAGDNAVCADVNTVNNLDQRGKPRPEDGDLVPGAVCDIGAYEVADITAPTITINNPDINAALSKTITASVSDGTLTMSNTTGLTCNNVLSFVPYSSQTFISDLDNGIRVCYKAVDASNNAAYSISNAIAGIDTTAPMITINNPDASAALNKTITASVSDGELTMSNTIGSTCNNSLIFISYSSQTFTSEADNGTKICYKAVDALGNTAYNMSNAIAGIDTTAPYTFIVSVEPATPTTVKTNIAISFSSPDAAATFECNLDNIGWVADCISPKTYIGLSLGSHTVAVRAKDTAGNVGASAPIVAWTIVLPSERVLNGSFDHYADASRIPKGWKATKFNTANGDGKDTFTHKIGKVGLKITGDGVKKTLTQQILFTDGAAGDVFTLSFWYKGNSLPKTGTCQIDLLLYNGSALTGKMTLKCATVAKWKNLTAPKFTTAAAYTRAAIKITFKKSSGAIWFDGVSLFR
jgi:hypothetical protein